MCSAVSRRARRLRRTRLGGCGAAPAYPPFFEIIELGGRTVVPLPLLDENTRPTLDLDGIDSAFHNGARSLLLCNPHNPTGRVFTTDELRAVSEIAEKYRARVVADEVHAPLVFPGAHHVPYATVSDAAAEHTLTITSASKAWNLAGLKCAQVVATNHADAKRWRSLPVFQVAGPTPLGIATSTAADAAGGPWLDELVAYLDGNRRMLSDLLAAELPEIACHLPEATFLAWLDCSALGVDDPARFFLDRAHVALSDGPPFGAGSEQYVRLNFATSRALLEQIVRAPGRAGRRPAVSRA